MVVYGRSLQIRPITKDEVLDAKFSIAGIRVKIATSSKRKNGAKSRKEEKKALSALGELILLLEEKESEGESEGECECEGESESEGERERESEGEGEGEGEGQG